MYSAPHHAWIQAKEKTATVNLKKTEVKMIMEYYIKRDQ